MDSSKTETVDSGPPEVWIKLTFSWSGKSMSIDVPESDRLVTTFMYPVPFTYMIFQGSLI